MFRVNCTQNILILIDVCTVYAGPLGPPQNLRIENLTNSSCILVWEPPSFDGGFEITGYCIKRSSEYHSRVVERNTDTNSRSQVTTTRSGRSSQDFWVHSSITQYTFDDLVEDTYECKVVAENKAGIRTSSDPIIFVASDRESCIVSDPCVAYGPWGKPGTPRVKEIAKGSLTVQCEALQSWEIDGGAVAQNRT